MHPQPVQDRTILFRGVASSLHGNMLLSAGLLMLGCQFGLCFTEIAAHLDIFTAGVGRAGGVVPAGDWQMSTDSFIF